jgi:glycyl-tRNA synthetase (class II)
MNRFGGSREEPEIVALRESEKPYKMVRLDVPIRIEREIWKESGHVRVQTSPVVEFESCTFIQDPKR